MSPRWNILGNDRRVDFWTCLTCSRNLLSNSPFTSHHLGHLLPGLSTQPPFFFFFLSSPCYSSTSPSNHTMDSTHFYPETWANCFLQLPSGRKVWWKRNGPLLPGPGARRVLSSWGKRIFPLSPRAAFITLMPHPVVLCASKKISCLWQFN